MHWSDRLVNHVLLPAARKPDEGPQSSAERMRAHAEQRRHDPAPHRPAKWAVRGCEVALSEREGMPVYTVTAAGPAGPEVVFLHGGAYVNEILVFHWLLIAQLARQAGARMIVPIYPMAPVAEAADVVPRVAALAHGAETVMGDSAGGGLALAVVQAGVQPRQLVLISPWLDVTCGDPAQPAIQSRDRMLRLPGLREAGRLWAGRLELTDPRVSPLFGDLAGLPPTTVFAGQDDLLYPDSTRLAARADVRLIAVPDAQHDFPVLPCRQGRIARRMLVKLCRDG